MLERDDPDLGIKDALGIDAEATAFAMTAAAVSLQPPLAVGIFGDWGSGKSTFMRYIQERIDNLADIERAKPADARVFHTDVVQVRFNAWHYAESNLWASLIEQIFSSLDQWYALKSQADPEKLFESMATHRRLTLEAAQDLAARKTEVQTAEIEAAEARASLAAARTMVEAAPATLLEAVRVQFFKGRGAALSLKFSEAAEAVGVGQAKTDAAALRSTFEALKTHTGSSALYRNGLLRGLGSWQAMALVFGGLLLLPVLVPVVDRGLEQVGLQLNAVSGALVTVTAPLLAAVGWASRQASHAIGRLNGFAASYDQAVDEATKDSAATLASAEAEIVARQDSVNKAEQQLAAALQQLLESKRAFAAGSGRARLFDFIRAKVENAAYAKHLSLVATIRKDFEELVVRMGEANNPVAEQALADLQLKYSQRVDDFIKGAGAILDAEDQDQLKASASPEPITDGFKRIVLYIDDLDRCAPKDVVAVLEAVHLLLTFPLFVVFVAVDVRWMRGALKERYGSLLTPNGQTEAVLALDYLEKIFQVPFWVRPMSTSAAANLLTQRMGPETLVGDGASVDGLSDDAQTRASPGKTAASRSTSTPSPAPAPPSGERTRAAMGFTAEERALIVKLAGTLDGSPRRALRYLNTYRVIKASLNGAQLSTLAAGGYAPLLTLLAISIGCDDLFAALVVRLAQVPNADLATLVEPPLPAPRNTDASEIERMRPRLKFALEALLAIPGQGATGSLGQRLAPYVDLAGRYGFDSGGVLGLQR